MKRVVWIVALVIARCATAPAPAPPPPQPVPEGAPAAEAAIGTVRVSATTLNVRREATGTSEVVAQVRKGERLALLTARGEWDRVRLANGTVGWVATEHVVREGTRSRRGCAADSDFSFVKTPTPAFSDSGAHGMVAVEANVDVRGNVTSTRVVANTTGDQALGTLAEREIRNAKFSPPIRNCVPKAFIFTYKRSF